LRNTFATGAVIELYRLVLKLAFDPLTQHVSACENQLWYTSRGELFCVDLFKKARVEVDWKQVLDGKVMIRNPGRWTKAQDFRVLVLVSSEPSLYEAVASVFSRAVGIQKDDDF
jgi:hypothetical protein